MEVNIFPNEPNRTGTNHFYRHVSDAMQRAPRGRIPPGFLHPHVGTDPGGFRQERGGGGGGAEGHRLNFSGISHCEFIN